MVVLIGTGVCEWFNLKSKYTLSLPNAVALSFFFSFVRLLIGLGILLPAGFVLYLIISIILNIPAGLISAALFGIKGIFSGKGFDKVLYKKCNTKSLNMMNFVSGAVSVLCAAAVYIVFNILPILTYFRNKS